MKKIAFLHNGKGVYIPKGAPIPSDRVDELLNAAYKSRNMEVIVTGENLKSEADGWFVGIDDENSERFDWFWCFKYTRFGKKTIVVGHTNETEAKQELIDFMRGEFTNSNKHHYVEASHGIEGLMKKFGIPPIPANYVGNIINKEITPVTEFVYERYIVPVGRVRKTMYGYPIFNKQAMWSNQLLRKL